MSNVSGAVEEVALPPPAAELKKLEEVDILKLESFFLKIQNLKLQGDKLQDDYKRCGQMILDLQTALRACQDTLSAKYGVDLTKCRIDASGTIIPSD